MILIILWGLILTDITAIYNGKAISDIPEDLFISIFAVGRIPGWTAQVVEQFENNILLRPRLQYVGELDREFIPIADRS